MSTISAAVADYRRRASEAALHTPFGVLSRQDINGVICSTARINGAEVGALEQVILLAPNKCEAYEQ